MALVLEYDGTRYHGFQIQAQSPTIQEEVELAVAKVNQKRLNIVAASRTDAGVHAKGQVVAFDLESGLGPETWVKALNYYLPDDIAVRSAYPVGDDFHARYGACCRRYIYTVYNGLSPSPLWRHYSYFEPCSLDWKAMDGACQALVGTHDFAAFSESMGKRSTIRTVYEARVWRERAIVFFEMAASSFLPHQVRRTAGALIRVGRGDLPMEAIEEMLESRRPGLAGPTAPAHGLCLMGVDYGDLLPKVGGDDYL
ncbi:MAG: tRNA pseudouridine(38-40) synthase TruA [Chloroflexi bacterium]|nr:tRNA pseudouridine(38-40) synthase TruA [Chloroflexota bacterium]